MAISPRPSRAPSRRSPGRRRSHLRLIPGGAQGKKSRRRASRAHLPFAVLTFVIVGALIFGLVILNIMAAEASFRLEELRQRTAEQEAAYRNMRYEVASRESPQQVSKAAETIGLVVPEKQEYILAPTPEGAPNGGGGSFATAEQEKEGEELKALKRP